MDVKLKLKIREAGASRDLDYFSAGWQDLFQIAERLSVVDALYKNEQPILILDDPFVNLDTAKYKRAMELLEALSEKRQMIYFTCRTERRRDGQSLSRLSICFSEKRMVFSCIQIGSCMRGGRQQPGYRIGYEQYALGGEPCKCGCDPDDPEQARA